VYGFVHEKWDGKRTVITVRTNVAGVPFVIPLLLLYVRVLLRLRVSRKKPSFPLPHCMAQRALSMSEINEQENTAMCVRSVLVLTRTVHRRRIWLWESRSGDRVVSLPQRDTPCPALHRQRDNQVCRGLATA
jgi:hypothetical protein